MKKRIVFFTVLIFAIISLQAQTPESTCKIKIADVSISTGFNGLINVSPFTLDEVSKLAPTALINSDNFKDYSFSTDDNLVTGGVVGFKLGLQFKDKKNNGYLRNPVLRLGLTYYGRSSIESYYNREIRTPYDTLISTQTGNAYYIDSVTSYNLNTAYRFEQIRFDASCIFRTPDKFKFTLYGGIGFNGGVVFNTRTFIDHNRSQYIENYDGFGKYENDFTMLMEKKYNQKLGYAFSAYIPLGMDLKLSKKHEFFSKVHLFYEMNFAFNFMRIPELKTIYGMASSHTFGVRVATWK